MTAELVASQEAGDGMDAKRAPMPPTGTFTNFIDRLAKAGVPAIIDKQFIGGSWANQREMHAALRFLGLIDEESKPTDALQSLANSDDTARREIYRVLVERSYAGALELGPRATQGQLESWFRSTGVTGESARKAQSFFLALARAANIDVSPYFKATRASTSPRTTKRTTKKKVAPAAESKTEDVTPPKPPASDGREHIHPSIIQILDRIPKPGKTWTDEERKMLVDTFDNLLKMFHPATSNTPITVMLPAAPPRKRTSPKVEDQAADPS